MSKQIEVTGCIDCPMGTSTGKDWWCLMQERPLPKNSLHDPVTPDWCPLKENSITISIKQ